MAGSAGPGSFTGLRIGAAAGKGLAFALDKPMAAVPTLDAMAYGCCDVAAVLCPLLDARRSEVYSGLYTYLDGTFRVWAEAAALPLSGQVRRAEALASDLGLPVMYLGDGLAVHGPAIRALASGAFSVDSGRTRFAPASMCLQRGVTVAELGRRMAEAGRTVTAMEFSPVYLRQSQAEQERLAQGLSIEPVYE